ncbi:hypothetical protein HY409_01800 [Candidatus Gottesmanbacteria bacterium]|nr:hypothetical protein [Candidatus Gottesmanbacteria bacterium]
MLFWKSTYKLPLSFIVFFVLMFFLLGEQLPALPTYFGFGPEGGNGKPHILDLGPSDALHRPVAYILIGTVIWGLFRIFSWPLAWTLGASLWALEQLTLTPLDQRPSLSNVIVFTFTFWIILTLVPYFIYRWVDKKWGGEGRRNAILIVLVINLLLFGFFAFQIYVLHNSYRGLQESRSGQQGNPSGSMPGLPPNTCPERLITERDKQTTAYWNGKTLTVSGEVQNWVEENCPGALERAE